MSGIDRVAERLRDEVYNKPAKIDATMLEVFSEAYIYYLAATALTNSQYPITSEQAIYRRELFNADFERVMAQYIADNRERAERELRQIEAAAEVDSEIDRRQAA